MSMLMAILVAAVAGAQDEVKITVKTMPPSVVKTVPQAGDTKVDPSLKEISVTFSKEMMTKEMWSWCSQSPETFPEIDRTKIRYLGDKRTCVLPVKLKAGKTYIIWINTQKFNYFKDIENNSAVPYLLVFQTARKAASLPHRDAEAAAISAAEAWLSLVDKGQYEKSWIEAAQYLKILFRRTDGDKRSEQPGSHSERISPESSCQKATTRPCRASQTVNML